MLLQCLLVIESFLSLLLCHLLESFLHSIGLFHFLNGRDVFCIEHTFDKDELYAHSLYHGTGLRDTRKDHGIAPDLVKGLAESEINHIGEELCGLLIGLILDHATSTFLLLILPSLGLESLGLLLVIVGQFVIKLLLAIQSFLKMVVSLFHDVQGFDALHLLVDFQIHFVQLYNFSFHLL